MKRRPGYLGAGPQNVPLAASLGLVLWLAACAHQPAAPPTTEAESSQQAEIRALERKISERKASLPGDSGSIAGAASEASPSQVQMSSGDSIPGGSAGRCDGVCLAAEDICTCHRRICKLASEINDERSAGSCRRAQRECEEAGRHCATCR